jgi:predicted RNA methylase
MDATTINTTASNTETHDAGLSSPHPSEAHQRAEEVHYHGTATYSPEDNKLRIYPFHRLDAETYARVKEAGFKWAPRQELFVAPAWTPGRESLARELCGAVGDEDTSLVARAEERAERFEDYSANRAADAESARRAVSAISENIPFGQPILVGHHSERRARKDAERIENGMRRAVKMWETSEYWQERAAGAIQAAKYKELPEVRYRRIKGLEADRRKHEREKQKADMWLKLWIECEAEQGAELQQAAALRIANSCWLRMPRKAGDLEDFNGYPTAYDALTNSHPTLYAPRTLAEVIDRAKKVYPATIAYCERWIRHYDNRIAYERAMLGEQGGLAADRFDIQPGGRVLIGREWYAVVRVTKKAGRIVSVTVAARYVPVRGIEEVSDYKEPTEEDAAKVKKVNKLGPICNYPGEGFIEMTKAQFDQRRKNTDSAWYEKVPVKDGIAAHRRPYTFSGQQFRYAPVFITDAKRVDPPKIESEEQAEPVKFERQPVAPVEQPMPTEASKPTKQDEQGELIAAMRDSLRQGVKVVTVPQLFPTPEPLAARMIELANIEDGQRVLEPSAGTARILDALHKNGAAVAVVAVEINTHLAGMIRNRFPAVEAVCADFKEAAVLGLGQFDRVLMNPPFANAEDIEHITLAHSMLKPGGEVVAICANGPRQNEKLRPLVEASGGTWEPLPPDTFRVSGTGVNAVLMVWPE